MIIRNWLQNPRNRRKAAFAAGVAALHAGLFLSLSQMRALPPPLPELPAFNVAFLDLTPPPPPPPPPEAPSVDPGGGQAAAPSVIHTPPEPPPEVPREVPAPVQKAPEQPLVIGVAPISSPTPGMGQGGEGTGVGGGRGSGSGPGDGTRTGPQNIRRPSNSEIRRFHPQAALRARVSGVGVVRCRIQADTRLDRCRVVSESPEGYGFGAAAVSAATELYRFRPATVDGAYDDSVSVTVVVEFGPQGRGPVMG